MELECGYDVDVKALSHGSVRGVLECDFAEAVSPAMRSVEVAMREVAQSDVPVLLLGEHGAGKMATARRIHELSTRAGQTFCVAQCAALGSSQFIELRQRTPHAGTVYLEEVTELSAEGQSLLLEALSDAIPDAGQPNERVRFICGSANDLESEVKSGDLREDLYYRISGVCLRLPPLRQRREDILVLTEHFLQKYAIDFQRTAPKLSDETYRLFHEYNWPGNIAELENAAKAIVALGDESVAMGGLRSLLVRPDANGNGGRVSLKQAARAASREAEKEMILRALARTRWNRRRAAQDLQISYKALLYKLKQMGCSQYGAS